MPQEIFKGKVDVAQSRSQSYVVEERLQTLINEEQGSSSETSMEEAPPVGKKNFPSSTYPQITGEELRYELLFSSRASKANKESQNNYFCYKEMVQMYQAEIKRRWDQRA